MIVHDPIPELSQLLAARGCGNAPLVAAGIIYTIRKRSWDRHTDIVCIKWASYPVKFSQTEIEQMLVDCGAVIRNSRVLRMPSAVLEISERGKRVWSRSNPASWHNALQRARKMNAVIIRTKQEEKEASNEKLQKGKTTKGVSKREEVKKESVVSEAAHDERVEGQEQEAKEAEGTAGDGSLGDKGKEGGEPEQAGVPAEPVAPKKKRAKRKPSTTKGKNHVKTSNGNREAIGYFIDKWKEAYGGKYPITGRDTGTITAINKRLGLDECKATIDNYFQCREKWYVRQRHPTSLLIAGLSRFMAVSTPSGVVTTPGEYTYDTGGSLPGGNSKLLPTGSDADSVAVPQ